MEKLKENKKVVIVFILLLIAISLGVSYAYWLIVKTQTGNNIISSACLNITFTGENDIKLTNAYPMNDEELYEFLTTTTPYHFTITNECEEETNVVINLETLGEEENKLGDQYMDVILYNGEKSFEEILMYNQLNTQIYSKSGSDDIWDYRLTNNLENSEKVLEEAIKAYRLYEFTLKGKESKSFNLIEYMSQDTPALEETMNKEFISKITVSTAYSPPLTRNMLAARTCEYSINEYFFGDYSCTENSDSVFQAEYIENTTKIVFENTMNPPSTYVASYDESSLKDGSIIAYVLKNEPTANSLQDESIVTYDAPPIYTIIFQTDGLFSMESGTAYFYGFTNVSEIEGLEYIDTSQVTHMDGMFMLLERLTSLDISNFDTSNVTDMSSMFAAMDSLTELDLSNFDTSKVTNMGWMFSFMNNLTTLDVSSFDTSKVTDMSEMFYYIPGLTELDVSNFDTSNVTSMNGMFANMSSLTTLDISNFDTSNVMDMSSMFYNLESLTKLDVSHFDTSNVTDMSYMFNYAENLSELDVSNFDTSNVTDMSRMFSHMENLVVLDLSNFDTSNVINMSYMFCQMRSLTKLDISNFDTSNVTDMNSMFCDMPALITLDISNFDTSNVTDMSHMFTGLGGLTELDLSNFDTSNVINMSYMFMHVSNLTTLDVSHFDTSNVTDMSSMFFGNIQLTNITYGDNFVYANSATITDMYSNCPANKPTDPSWDGVI